LQLAVYFRLHTGEHPVKGCAMASHGFNPVVFQPRRVVPKRSSSLRCNSAITEEIKPSEPGNDSKIDLATVVASRGTFGRMVGAVVCELSNWATTPR
jgi:hypothetical protein